jgi:hypothetical protein
MTTDDRMNKLANALFAILIVAIGGYVLTTHLWLIGFMVWIILFCSGILYLIVQSHARTTIYKPVMSARVWNFHPDRLPLAARTRQEASEMSAMWQENLGT